MAYELSGPVANPRATTMTWREAIPAIEEFMRSDGGLINGKIAIDYALKKVPEVDPNQLFACGHSSSAVVSLNLARGDSRIRACCAYAPSTDVEAWWKPARVENHVPGFTAFAERKSPRRHVEDFSCPVFLFHADDDSMVALSDNQRFANAMKDAGKRITFERVKSGDHYDSMIEHGIPDGIAFMQSNGAKPLPPVTHGPK
jgi:acetyl esterase/lipase